MTRWTRLFGSVAVALMAWASLESCGDPKTANGTAFLVTVNWSAPTADVFQIEFLAPMGGFPAARKPDAPGAKLTFPATVRILLSQGPDAGGAMQVRARALGAGGRILAVGTTTATPVSGREVDVDISLGAVDFTDGGVPDAGVSDAGIDAGKPDAGKVDAGMCPQCASQCCFVGNFGNIVCQPGPLGRSADGGASMLCGNPGDYCKVVETLLADHCDGPVARCGNSGPCARGTRCDPATHECICDRESVCDGCCQTYPVVGSVCVLGGSTMQGPATCGAASQACAACPAGGCNMNAGYYCSASCDATCMTDTSKCCAGTSCQKIDFPTCRASMVPKCSACDRVRSDRCGASATGCNCGANPSCRDGEFCFRLPDAGAGCVAIPNYSL